MAKRNADAIAMLRKLHKEGRKRAQKIVAEKFNVAERTVGKWKAKVEKQEAEDRKASGYLQQLGGA